MNKKTKKYWYDHIRDTIEVSTTCKLIDCRQCIDLYGPCRKNIMVNEFAKLIEMTDLPNN